jgi:hypothetical protein
MLSGTPRHTGRRTAAAKISPAALQLSDETARKYLRSVILTSVGFMKKVRIILFSDVVR